MRVQKGKYATFAAVMLATGSLALSPMIVPAFAAKSSGPEQKAAPSWIAMFTPAGGDSVLAQKFSATQIAPDTRFPFTPASAGEGRNRTITVAARANSRLTAGAVSLRNVIAPSEVGAAKGLRLAAVDYRLTASKGWQDFALPKAQARAAKTPLSDVGKGSFRLDESAKKPSKFSTNIKLDQNKEMAPPARGSGASGDYKLDVGGSFSISRKIDVTAGVRYTSENDRVLPLPDNRKDSEAVYVGTKIRF
ncbi:MAG: hypothetical protein ACK519_08015 [Sphingomonadaceae bacterium]|jgi:hypothetical protein